MAQEDRWYELYVVVVACDLSQALRLQAVGGAKRYEFCLSVGSCPELKSQATVGMHNPAAMSQDRAVLSTRGDMDGNIDELE